MAATITPDWMQGRTTYGGLSAALCPDAVQRAVPDLPPLRSANVMLVGPAGGAVRCTAQELRRGRSVTFYDADLVGEKGLATRCAFAFGAARDSMLDRTWTPPPNVPHANSCEVFIPPGAGPAYTQHFESRLAAGARPMSGSEDHDHFIGFATSLMWLGWIAAMSRGYLWALVLVNSVVALGLGYADGVLASARSRDAHGHKWLAVLALIPVANAWLLFKPAKHDRSDNRLRTHPLFTDALGVITGLVLFAAAGTVYAVILVQMNRIMMEPVNSPTLDRIGVGFVLRQAGPEPALRVIADGGVGYGVDETTRLRRIVNDGATLRYVYDASPNSAGSPVPARTGLVETTCANQVVRRVIEAGATVEHVYRRGDGSENAVVVVTRDDCVDRPRSRAIVAPRRRCAGTRASPTGSPLSNRSEPILIVRVRRALGT